MKPKVLLTRALMPEAVELLQADFDLEIGNTERMLTKAELLEKIQGKDVIISMLADQMDRETLDAAPDLKLIANYAVGYNNIDVPATIEKNIPQISPSPFCWPWHGGSPRRTPTWWKADSRPGSPTFCWAWSLRERPSGSSAWDGSGRPSPGDARDSA